MTYFALQSDLVSIVSKDQRHNFAFYVVFSFVSGFSERLAQDMLLGTALHVAPKRKEPKAKADAPPPARADQA